ncbi:putative HAD-superfamily hydrolase [Desulfosarcina variabilis str. Montpellier]|uniref:HAD family hydrolase n=1 Tax=Desulfosarcina variabilis TaxID=2300 RepID=UPI003AFAC5D5
MNRINIFFDLDGTLVDCKYRLYNLFQELVPQSNFSFNDYCKIKSNKIDQKKLLQKYFNYSNDEVVSFKKNWLNNIEDESRLKQDKLLFSFKLSKFSNRHDLFVVTNRQYKDRAIKQLENLGIAKYFKKILVTEQKMSKLDLIKANVIYSSRDIIVGDTGEDLITGKELNIKTVAVLTGILKKEILMEYNPDLLVKDIKEFYASTGL